jgi:hypothetical protein
MKDLAAFSHKPIPVLPAGQLTVDQASEVVNALVDLGENRKTANGKVLAEMKAAMSGTGRKYLTRAELAWLLDRTIDPFSVPVDHNGAFVQ